MKDVFFLKLYELYHSKYFPDNTFGLYELSLIDGIKNKTDWENLTYLERLQIREGRLNTKKINFNETTPKYVIPYEESVIALGYKLLYFLEQTSPMFDNLEEAKYLKDEMLILFRLRNMLLFELDIINKHIKLVHGGHVPFDEIISPILAELKNTDLYSKYALQEIEELYIRVMELYSLNPYSKPK